jgi:DHA1 family bicyclomycin/chloramphenicol resistance-like MFS transporter
MNPDAATLWRRPRSALAALLACLGMLGAFSIDTYIPAFAGIARSLDATPVQMQQTLSAYLLGFAVMNLFHGALADSFGRRPVVLWGIAIFTLSSLGCALSHSVGQLVFFRLAQGMSSGASMVVGRAIIRDMFPPDEAQRVMSQVTIYFGVAPAVAPIVGGLLLVHFGWHSVFVFLTGVGVVMWTLSWRLLPETLHHTQVQPFHPAHLLKGYWEMFSSPRFLALALASGVPFNGMFLYILSAPEFLGHLLHLEPTHFFFLFLFTIGGIMGGAFLSGRLAGKMERARQIRIGFTIMFSIAVVNLLLNSLFTAQAWWAIPPIGVFSFGWALMVPVVTLLVLDQAPMRRGMASSLQACIGSVANAFVAGVISPLVMHSTVLLALASLLMSCIGIVAWFFVRNSVLGPESDAKLA